MRPLRIDLVAPGRFYCFDLAAALIGKGHDVRMLTNYPAGVCARWGVPEKCVRSLPAQGLAARAADRLQAVAGEHWLEPQLMRWFGRWAARAVRADADLVHVMSGAAEELLGSPQPAGGRPRRQLGRGSSHIRVQHRLLAEEEARIGSPVEKPSRWMIEREEREYALADEIVVLSSFAEHSFVEHGTPRSRLRVLPLGVSSRLFAAREVDIEERCRRIAAGRPLHVITVGTISARKGAFDLLRIAAALTGHMQFSAVANVTPDASRMMAAFPGVVAVAPRVAEAELVDRYRDADLFLLPTIEDGYAAVLSQALAAGLPVLATTNCSAPDVVRDGRNGWVLPIRDADRFIARLKWCDANRAALAGLVRQARASHRPRSWDAMADDLVASLVPA